ncbi:MAG: DnaD domain protein [Chloroflexi bacterium]|nr:DnaD domain protein [Chloroflexota bacterium]
MKPFPGFAPGSLATAVPNAFFTAVLPQIQRPEELIVSLYFFFAQGRKRRHPRYLTEAELLADTTLLRALAGFCADPAAAAREGLALAAERGTLLCAEADVDGRRERLYLLNLPQNRERLAELAGAALEGEQPPPAPDVEPPPGIFALYEENIGSLTPLIAQELEEAESRYPPAWVEAAFREAVSLNKRNWRYVRRILERWEAEGPDYETSGRDPEATARGKRPLSGRYRQFVRH